MEAAPEEAPEEAMGAAPEAAVGVAPEEVVEEVVGVAEEVRETVPAVEVVVAMAAVRLIRARPVVVTEGAITTAAEIKGVLVGQASRQMPVAREGAQAGAATGRAHTGVAQELRATGVLMLEEEAARRLRPMAQVDSQAVPRMRQVPRALSTYPQAPQMAAAAALRKMAPTRTLEQMPAARTLEALHPPRQLVQEDRVPR